MGRSLPSSLPAAEWHTRGARGVEAYITTTIDSVLILRLPRLWIFVFLPFSCSRLHMKP